MKNDSGNLRLPDFLGIGPQRTGTTWLHQALQLQLGMPRGHKELHFFDHHYARGLRWYASQFNGYPPHLKVGEVTASYFYSAQAQSLIARDLPQCKIICSLREPVARMFSGYRLMSYRGFIIEDSFERALDKYRSTSVNRSLYADSLRSWLQTFGSERVLVCLYDDLQTDPQSYLDRVTDFLQTPRIWLANSPLATNHVNSHRYLPRRPRLANLLARLRQTIDFKWDRNIRPTLIRLRIWQFCFADGPPFPPLDPQVEANLRERLRPDVEAVEELIGRDLSAWKRPSRIEQTAQVPNRQAS